jgi:hydratase-aldolase
MVLGPDKFKGVFALVPACATPDAHKWEAVDTFDKDSFSTLVDRLIRDGVHGVMTTGSMGEGHTLLWEEQKRLFETVVDVVNGRVPVIMGTWAPNTREAIVKSRYAADIGADGVLSGPPHYEKLSVDNVVQYYKDLSEACPDIAIVIYHNPSVFRVTIPVERYVQIMEEIPNAVAVKETLSDTFRVRAEAELCKGKIGFMAMENNLMEAMKCGFTGCWSVYVNMNPKPTLRLYEACVKKEWKTAREITAAFNAIWAKVNSILEQNGLDFFSYEENIMHIMVNESGYAKTGPARRPFAIVPEAVEKAAKLISQEHKEIVKKFFGEDK